ncbi:SDR family NAD(P)-dependent oxidoreductase [Streptomyces sp. NPDC003077]|uniref:SDR family NAD(P)-dependent oxidoreductase n=1 Tax=Streptomyces sp. NPDC003077 TaxID=3154443 RepID=UPI0033BBC8CF
MFDLPGESGRKVALVVGGYGSVGRIVCGRLAEDGYTVAVAGRSAERAGLFSTRLAGGAPRSLPYVVDLARWESIDRVVADVVGDFGRLDAVVNLAVATTSPGPDAAEWTRVLGVNVAGAYRLGQVALRTMHGTGLPGRLVLLTPATPAAAPGDGARPISRACATGVITLVEEWAARSPGGAVTVNAVVPRAGADASGVATAVQLLLRPEARHVSGHSIVVNGSAAAGE